MAATERETGSLIGSDKVEGTAVYGADGNKIGSIERVMIDKMSGKVAYAVTSFGGFLGMGEDYYPLPWPTLKYDTGLDGYRVNLTEDQLKKAPSYKRNGTGRTGRPISASTVITIRPSGIKPTRKSRDCPVARRGNLTWSHVSGGFGLLIDG